MIDLIAGLALISVLVAVGWMEIKCLLPAAHSFEAAGIAFPLGAGTVTWGLFLLSWLGVPIGWASTIGLIGGGLILLVWRHTREPRELASNDDTHVRPVTKLSLSHIFRWSIVAAWAVILITAMLISVSRAHGSWDAAAGWVVKGYGIIHEGAASAGQRWGAWGLSYPLNFPLQNGLFALIGAEELPGSKLLPPVYLASLALSVTAFLWRKGVSWQLSGGAGLLLLTNPLLFRHGTIGYANLPLAAYLVPGVCLSIEGLSSKASRRLLAGGALIAMGIWTRPEGIVYAAAILGAMLISLVVIGGSWDRVLDLWPWVIPVSIVGGLWLLFSWSNIQSSHLGSAMDGFQPQWLGGELHLYELHLIPRTLLKRAFIPRMWGLLFPVSTVLLVVGIGRILFPRSYPVEFGLLSTVLLTALVPIALFYVRSFTRSDFVALLHRSFDRSFLPSAVLFFTLSFLLAFGGSMGDEVDESRTRNKSD